MIDDQTIYLPEFSDCKFCGFPAHGEVGKVTVENAHVSGVSLSKLFKRSFASCQQHYIGGFRSSKKELSDCKSNPYYDQYISSFFVGPACGCIPREAPVIMMVFEDISRIVR